MIFTVQVFGLNGMGGGSRILRSLLKDAPAPVLSINTNPLPGPPTETIEEIHLPVRPHMGRLESTRLGPYLAYLNRWFLPRFEQKLEQLARERKARAIHGIPQGVDFIAAFRVARRLRIPFYLTVHDDLTYNQYGRPDLYENMRWLREIWLEADGRMVISEAMGREYNRLFGKRPYVRVTDGLTRVTHRTLSPCDDRLVVYFMGSVHLSYRRNFDTLRRALESYHKHHPSTEVVLRVRGGLPFPLVSDSIRIEVLPWGTQEDIEADLDEAHLLYFPLPFEQTFRRFTRFSLSTKLVTYLGSGIPILYHGPHDSAAAAELHPAGAAEMTFTLIPDIVARAIESAMERRHALVHRARNLALERFMLEDQRSKFWGMLLPSTRRITDLRSTA